MRAYMWSSLGAATVPEARELMKELEAGLTKAEVAEARRLADEWRARYPAPTP